MHTPSKDATPSLLTMPAMQSETRTLAAFHEILTQLVRTGSHPQNNEAAPHQTLTLLAEKACDLTGCASAVVVLLDETREMVRFVAAYGEAAREMVGSEVRASDTLTGSTARTGEPFWAFREGTSDTVETVDAAADNSLGLKCTGDLGGGSADFCRRRFRGRSRRSAQK